MTIEFWQVLLGSALATLLSSLIAYLQIRANGRKNKADAADTLTDTALVLITPLRTEVERLAALITSKDTEIAGMNNRIKLLEEMLVVKNSEISERDIKIASLEAKVRNLEAEVLKLQGQIPPCP